MPSPERTSAEFETQRPRLLRLAYRMTGSVAEAEDVVQDAWLRWSRADEPVAAPAAYLNRIVTRLCLDHMRSARVRRETYVGAWLPEPLVGTTEDEQGDDISFSLMLALERLSPLERAAYLLHDVFGQPLDEIAVALDREAPAVRQLAVRARRHVRTARSRFTVEASEADRITHAFFTATRDGDVSALGVMLAHDVVVRSDGGGRVVAFLNPVVGIAKVLRLFAGLARKRNVHAEPILLENLTIDGLPGYVSADRGRILQTTALDIRDGRIAAIYIVRNPDKLRHVATRPAVEPPLPGQDR